MRDWQSQAHVKHYCKYNVVFVSKYRKKSTYGALRKDIRGMLREFCYQHGLELLGCYAMKDHIHMLLMIPPKSSVANTIGFLKWEISDTDIQGLYAGEAEFYGATFQGKRILCKYR